ncbi:ABC transporter substrate-binding protein, partial [Halomonas sp. BBD48]|nr:ABC transporter substrate-binding protein [Halomonas sp. BBD48]
MAQKLFSIVSGSLLALVCAAAPAKELTVTDIAGREVTVDAPVDRIILGEGRQIYLLSVLEPENPFARVVGWREDFPQADPDNYAQYAAEFPQLKTLPTFGGFKDGTFDVEQAAALQPDVVFMNIEAKAATEEASYDDKLAKLGIPIVYVDFREDPLQHTIPSMRLMGQLMGEEDRAEAFIDFSEAQMKRVTDVIGSANPERPDVFVDRAGGYSEDCCMSFGDGNFGEYVELAGGNN